MFVFFKKKYLTQQAGSYALFLRVAYLCPCRRAAGPRGALPRDPIGRSGGAVEGKGRPVIPPRGIGFLAAELTTRTATSIARDGYFRGGPSET